MEIPWRKLNCAGNSIERRKKNRLIQHNLSTLWSQQLLSDNKRYISVSHCKGLVSVISSAFPVGIDVEQIKFEHKRERLLSSSGHLLLEQYSFTEIWTLKESVAKLFRIGLPTIDTVCIQQIEKNKARVQVRLDKNRYIFKNIYFYYRYIEKDYKMCIAFYNEIRG